MFSVLDRDVTKLSWAKNKKCRMEAVLKRMLNTPPKPHENTNGKSKRRDDKYG
jgi:hypothetical protein